MGRDMGFSDDIDRTQSGNDGRGEEELRNMVRTLLDKVDSLERQLADGQGDASEAGPDGHAGQGSPEGDSPSGGVPSPEGASGVPGSPVGREAPQADFRPQFPQPSAMADDGGFDDWDPSDDFVDDMGVPGTAETHDWSTKPFAGGVRTVPPQFGPPEHRFHDYTDGYPDDYRDGSQNDAPGEFRDVPLRPDVIAIGPSVEREEAKRRSREGWLGMYGTGIAASVLVVLGAFVAMQVSGGQVPPLARVGILFAIGMVMEAAGIVLVRKSESGPRNGFLTSIAATGTITTFLALCVGGMLYGMYGPPLLGLMLLAWFAVQLVLSNLAGTKSLYAIAYVGGAAALVLEGSQVSESLNPVTASVFALLALLVPVVSLTRRGTNPVVPYASAGFSVVTSAVGSWLLLSTAQERGMALMPMEQCVMSDPSFAILLVSSFLSACAVLCGASLAHNDGSRIHGYAKVATSSVGLVLMARSLLVMPWATPVVPYGSLVLVALTIVACMRNEMAEVPLAIVGAWALAHLWDLPAVPAPIPSLVVACVIPLLPWSRSSHVSTAATLAFVATSWAVMWGAGYGGTTLPWVALVSVLAAGSCVSAFRLSADAIRLGEAEEEEAVRLDERPRFHDVPLIQVRFTPRRRALLRRIVPLIFATMASMALMPLSGTPESPVPPDIVPATLTVLLALHMAMEMRKIRERDDDGEGREWFFPPRIGDSLDRSVRICRTTLMVGACVMAVSLRMGVTFQMLSASHGASFAAIACVAYSVTLFLAPTCLVVRSIEGGSKWGMAGTILLAHLAFLAVAWVWVQEFSMLIASCISIAMSVAIVMFGFRQRRGDIRIVGLVSMLAFVVKVALMDIPRATNTSLNALALVVAGVLCFGISFAYNRACRLYMGDDGEAMPDGPADGFDGSWHDDMDVSGMPGNGEAEDDGTGHEQPPA